jgi:CheY-like chemotaxis protein
MNATIESWLQAVLAHEGFLVVTAASGEEGLAVVAQEPPDLILLDVMMPRMSGYQVAVEIKGNLATKNIPVIMVTAHSLDLDPYVARTSRTFRARASGVIGFCMKATPESNTPWWTMELSV